MKMAVALAALILLTAGAAARWKPEYASAQYAEWFRSQYNGQGQWCCDEADGHFFDGTYTLNHDGSVTIDTADGPHTLPEFMVLKSPNPTGRAVWWRLGGHDYCFAPGALG